jgi:hypothetical protein
MTHYLSLAVALVLSAPEAAMAKTTPELVALQLDRGPLPNAEWKGVVARITDGNPHWLRLAPRLADTGNAAGGEGLRIALSNALQRNPDGVLGLISPQFPADKICTDNDIEPSARDVEQFYAATIPAVAGVNVAKLAAVRDVCLAALRKR